MVLNTRERREVEVLDLRYLSKVFGVEVMRGIRNRDIRGICRNKFSLLEWIKVPEDGLVIRIEWMEAV